MKKSIWLAICGLLLGAGMAQAQFVRVAPPPPPVEHREPAPDARHVWVPGYQRWDGRAYHWQAGKWVSPPRPRASWEPGRWESRPGGYAWVPGHWRS